MHKDCTFQPNKTDNSGIDASVLSEKLFKDGEDKKARLKVLTDERLNQEKEA